jgi:hypothetical protein
MPSFLTVSNLSISGVTRYVAKCRLEMVAATGMEVPPDGITLYNGVFLRTLSLPLPG